MQNAPMTALLPDALVMFAVVIAWLNDTFVGQDGRRTTYFIAFFSTVVRSSAAMVDRSRMAMRCLRLITVFLPR